MAYIELHRISMGSNATEQEGKLLIQDLNLTIEEGDIIGIVAEHGKERRVISNILAGLVIPSTGSYFIKDEPLLYESDSKISRIRNRDIGYVSDSYPLLPKASVLENVCLPLIYGTYSKKQKKKLGLKSLGTVDMEGCQYREAWTLTPGEKICVMLARAIVNRPRLFVGEDLLENLNRVQTDKILNIVKRMPNMGITCVLIMRDPELLEVCSRKYLLKEGKLVEYT